MHSLSRRRLVAAAAASLCAAGLPAFAQDFPSRAISMVVGTAAGSGADVLVRFIADRLRALSGQAVVVENKPGAFGNIAVSAVKAAKPDGHTVLFAPSIAFAAAPYMFKNLPFDPVKDFVPVGTISHMPFFLVVSGQKPAKTVAELTALLKAKGAKGSYGAPTGISLAAAEMYKSTAGLDTSQIPYKTMQQALVDLGNGDIDFVFVDAATIIGHLGGGKFRVLAVTTEKRSSAAPAIPTMLESGLPGYQPVSVWFALALPAGTPGVVADKLNGWLNQILASEEMAKFLRNGGSDVLAGSRRDMEAFQAREIANWGRLAKIAKIEPQ
ncbi:Bug family tripartite tricarboxylate transporter substrate binding protein [Ramlibacter sp.]|uniref:Bug family tripartite tricarboxylate transporter substrate binding protein n=1 Tax=Ramlibacter sp. TaxID=1917967 RepID=UPI003D0FD773